MYGSPVKRATIRREPSTPRKRGNVTAQLLTPDSSPEEKRQKQNDLQQLFPGDRKLVFEGEDDSQSINATGSMPSKAQDLHERPELKREGADQLDGVSESDKNEGDIFFQGKALFQRGSRIRAVVGRGEEKKRVRDRLSRSTSKRSSAALYVSGLPGTGKSALVAEILESTRFPPNTHVATINCMTIEKPDTTYALIAKQFGYLQWNDAPEKNEAAALLQAELERRDASHVLVLDELDQIVTADQEILFTLFEWACAGATNFVLVGIANAIDLTDRFLPRLQAHSLKPEVIAFKPYTTQGITEIIEARLAQLPGPLMHPAAVRICAAKTAANSGDLRKAFDVCRRAIEVVESEGGQVVTTQTVARVCQVAFGGIDARERLRLLNFQQRAVLCALMKQERLQPAANITVLQAFNEYGLRCAQRTAFNVLTYPEYMEVVNALEAAGLVAVTGLCGKKGLGSHKAARVSRGGSGAAGTKGSDGYRDEFGLRKISSRAQMLDVVADLADNDPLRDILM